MESSASCVVNAHIVSLSEEVRSELLRIVHARKPGAPVKAGRTGFTRHKVAKWFAVSEMEVYRWDTGKVAPPAGYCEALRLSGDFEQMGVVMKHYWDLRRLKGGDALSPKRVIHTDDDNFLYHKGLK